MPSLPASKGAETVARFYNVLGSGQPEAISAPWDGFRSLHPDCYGPKEQITGKLWVSSGLPLARLGVQWRRGICKLAIGCLTTGG